MELIQRDGMGYRVNVLSEVEVDPYHIQPTSFPYRNIYNYMHRKSDKKHETHHIHRYTTHNNSQRLKKPTTFNNSRYTTTIPTDSCTSTTLIEIASSQSLKHFIAYIKNDMIGTYRETCDIVNCYIVL